MNTERKPPAEGVYFDRHDIEGEHHDRTYFVDGKACIHLLASPDADRPGKWQVLASWTRRGRHCVVGWGPIDTEAEALTLMDAVGIGAEGISGGAVFLGHLQESAPAASEVEHEGGSTGRVQAFSLCASNGWNSGAYLASQAWEDGKITKRIMAMDEQRGVELAGGGSRYWTRTLPSDVHQVAQAS